MVETPDGFCVVRLADVHSPDMAQDPIGAAQFRDALTKALDQDMQSPSPPPARPRQAHGEPAMLDSLLQ